MNSGVFAALMAAAALHAGWNVLVRGAGDRTTMMVSVALMTSALSLLSLPFLHSPDRSAWVFVIISIVIHVVSYDLVARTYRIADMSLAYPLMRGTAPLLTALFSMIILADYPTLGSCVGIATISFGVLSLVSNEWVGQNRAGILTAVANAVLITGYTLVDGAGIRAAHGGFSYILWMFLGSGVAYTGWWVARTHGSELNALVHVAPRSIGGALASMISYGTALWAMTVTSIAAVAATRETSIAFGVMFSTVFLKESLGFRRVAAAAIIISGAVMLHLL